MGALGAVGAIGYAAQTGKQAVEKVHVKVVGSRAHTVQLGSAVRNAAADQYTLTQGTTRYTATSQSQQVSLSAVVLPPDTSGQSDEFVQVFLNGLATSLSASSGGIIQLTIDINSLTRLSRTSDAAQVAPIGLKVPLFTPDLKAFSAIPALGAARELPKGQTMGWYRGNNGATVVLTTRLGYFGIGRDTRINRSESGRPLPAVGSGLFGDPARSTSGAPKLTVESVSLEKAAPKSPARVIGAQFFVGEQAALYVRVLDADGKSLQILQSSSGIRGRQLKGGWVNALHAVVLNPGTMTVGAAVRKSTLKPGTYTVQLTAVDYDGLKTTQSVKLSVS